MGFEVFRCRHVGNDKHERVISVSVANGCAAKKLVAPFKIHCLALLLHHRFKIPTDTLKWFTEFGHLNRGDMLTSEQYRCTNETKKF